MVEVPVSNEKLLSFRGDHVESHRRQGNRESKVQTASGTPPAKDVQQVKVVIEFMPNDYQLLAGSTFYLEN